MDLVSPIIEIVKSVGGPIVKHLKDQIKFDDHLEQFNVRKQGLCNRKCDIESRLNTELQNGNGKIAQEEVQTWLKAVENFIAKQEVADEVNEWGCLSCCCRVKILKERTQELNEIYDRGDSFINVCLVKDDPSFLGVELQTTKLQGSEDVEAEILTSLMGDEVTKLGVWGMGGIGKTTIMKHVHNKLLKGDKFKKVIWVTVSQTFDSYKLQGEIACSLDKKDELDKHKDTVVRAGMLSKMLEGHRPYLLILDDVWKSFDLLEVGIPEPLAINGCKLVLTTRSKEVTCPMGCENIEVKTLSRREALDLFIDKVRDTVLSEQGCIKGTLKSTLQGIVDECGGLPLAIVTVAGSLKGKSEPQLWSAALNQLKNCKRNVAGTSDGDIFGILKFSYHWLKDRQIQHRFLCCALYPEDYNIPIDSITEYWIDEGLIDEMETLQAMEDEGHDTVRRLVDNCLLESIEGEFGKQCVRMHDLVRDMALHITRTSPRFMVEAGKALTELPEKGKWTEDLEKVSLMRNEIKEIPSSLLSSKCIMVTTLLLSNNNLSTIPESVLEHMPALKILDLSYNHQLRSLPSSISRLVNLTTLLLHCCESLIEVPSLSELEALKKLNLCRTQIKEVPKGLEMCTNLKYLHLGGFDGILDDAIFLNLSKLQQLYVGHNIMLKGEMIGRLKRLEAFDGQFPTADEWSIFLKCFHGQGHGLSRYLISVGGQPCTVGVWLWLLHHAKKCMVLYGIDIVGENIILLPSVSGLSIESCNDIRSLNDFSSLKDVTDMRLCRIEQCRRMECVFSAWINPLVETLEGLSLEELDKLEGLFEAEAIAMSPPPPAGTFSSLQVISLSCCGKIKKLIPSWKLLGYLQSLENISVCNCKEMEEIITSDQSEEEGEGGDHIIKKLILPKLKYLTLTGLPALKSICSKRAVMVSDSLEQIWIQECNGLRRIPLPLDNAQPSPPPSLKKIEVSQAWWESLEWDHPNAKDVLRPLLRFPIDTRFHHRSWNSLESEDYPED